MCKISISVLFDEPSESLVSLQRFTSFSFVVHTELIGLKATSNLHSHLICVSVVLPQFSYSERPDWDFSFYSYILDLLLIVRDHFSR